MHRKMSSCSGSNHKKGSSKIQIELQTDMSVTKMLKILHLFLSSSQTSTPLCTLMFVVLTWQNGKKG